MWNMFSCAYWIFVFPLLLNAYLNLLNYQVTESFLLGIGFGFDYWASVIYVSFLSLWAMQLFSPTVHVFSALPWSFWLLCKSFFSLGDPISLFGFCAFFKSFLPSTMSRSVSSMFSPSHFIVLSLTLKS